MSKELEFIAQMINAHEAEKEGYSMSLRWGCLNNELRVKYLNIAQEMVDRWFLEEEDAKAAREQVRG